jgi:hypothetical protein
MDDCTQGPRRPQEIVNNRNGDPSNASEMLPPLNTPTIPPEAAIDRSGLSPVPLLSPKRKVDLARVEMSGLPEVMAVEQLAVRELKGIGTIFTPKMDQMLSFRGLVYQPAGEFDVNYQLIAGPLLLDPRIVTRTKTIAIIPAFVWSSCEVVLAPWKMTKFGARTLRALQSLQPEFPNYKMFVEWSDVKTRHIVQKISTTPDERELISKVRWPNKDQIIEALQLSAYDSIDDLAAANAEIKILLNSREVE